MACCVPWASLGHLFAFSGRREASFKGVTSVLCTNNLLAHTMETLVFTSASPLGGQVLGEPLGIS